MRRFRFTMYALLTSAAVLLYGSTLHTSVQAADNAELQLVALTFGVAHPPGYPLWSAAAGLFARLPGLSPLTGLALFSLCTSVAAVLATARTIEIAAAPRPARGVTVVATAAAALIATGDTFWVQATTTNIRSLTALFAALLAWSAAHAYRARSMPAIFGAIVGLAVAHHPSLAFPALPITCYVLLRDGRSGLATRVLRCMMLFLAVQVVWMYLPLRDVPGAAFAPGGLRTLAGFANHALARGFGGDMFWFIFVEPRRLFDRLALLPMLATFALGAPVAALMALGAAVALWRKNSFALLCVGAAVLHLFVTLTYRAPQTVEYAMPAWMLIGVVGGIGLASMAVVRQRRVVGFVVALLVWILASYVGVSKQSEFAAMSRDRSALERAKSVLFGAPRDAVVLAQWHQATPLLLLQRLEKLRDDVRIEYVAPNGAQPYAETFAARARAFPGRPVLATSFFADEFAAAGLYATPLVGTPAWIVEEAGAAPRDEVFTATFDERIAVRAQAALAAATQPGDLVTVDVAWRAQPGREVLPGDAVTVRFFRADGRLAANADVQLSPGRNHGARRVLLGIPLDLAPGSYVLQIGAYRTQDGGVRAWQTSEGAPFAAFGALEIVAASQPVATRRPLTWLPCEDLCIEGIDYDLGLPGRVRLWVHAVLGAKPNRLSVFDAAGAAVAAPCEIPAGIGRRHSCAFDIPPLRGLQLRADGLTFAVPDYLDGEMYVPFGGRMVLIGVTSRRSAAEEIVDLRWLAARSLIDDYVVSVRVGGAAHDGVPALGALPTLKWMRGRTIEDRHPIGVVDRERRAAVVVYDSVTRTDLPVLDERYEGRFTLELPERP